MSYRKCDRPSTSETRDEYRGHGGDGSRSYSFDNAARDAVHLALEQVNEAMTPGTKHDHGVFVRFDNALARAWADEDLETIERHCNAWVAWQRRQFIKQRTS